MLPATRGSSGWWSPCASVPRRWWRWREALHPIAPWTAPAIDAALKAVAESASLGMGKVAQPVRVAVMGMPVSPPIGETLELLGKVETLERIDTVLAG
jgi:glutamyl-tRNA synthetase